jgi:S1-C subfamily serine protease
VWVGDNAILTARHCVAAVRDAVNSDKTEGTADVGEVGLSIKYGIEKEFGGDMSLEGSHISKVVAVDDEHDLALLQAVGKGIPKHQIVRLAEYNPAIGSRLDIVGHPNGILWSYYVGYVAGYRDQVGDKDIVGPFIQVEAPIWHGNSGGGIFYGGKLVGIVSFAAGHAPSLAFGIGLKTLRTFLTVNLK